MKSNTKNQQKKITKSNEPLLKIPEQKIVVYNDRIQIPLPQKYQKFHSLHQLQTNPTLSQIPQKFKYQYREIYFSSTDIVFKLIEKDKKIVLSKIGTYQKPFTQLFVQNDQQRKILHQLLKRKWIEYGFQQQYNLLEQIGKGAMAKVYLIQGKQDHIKYAAKIISLKIQCQKTYDTFINQTNILRILNNPHIVHLEGIYISQKKQLIAVLQYLNGGTLFEELKEKRINTIRQKFKALKDITLGLEHLRQKRIVHRDLKLENIMIRIKEDGEKQYVITDFGLSNWIGQKNILFQKCGTPGYLAPQILHEKKGICLLTHSTDIFSLGVLYHFILTNHSVFQYQGCAKKLLQTNKRGKFHLHQAFRMLSQKQYALLQKTLQIDPTLRASTKQLLQIYFPQLEQYIIRKQQKQQKLSARKSSRQKSVQQKKINQKERLRTHENTHKIQQNLQRQKPAFQFNNTELDQKLPTYKKRNITVIQVQKTRSKTQQSEQKSLNSRISMQSARKFIGQAVKKITSPFSSINNFSFKTKNKVKQRQTMKSFIQ